MMLNRIFITVFVLTVATSTATLSSQEPAGSEFKDSPTPAVKRIVLYNSGVGQLQHEGVLEGKSCVQLKFSTHDVSDVLKSLAISDDGGGHVRAIEYQPAPDPEDIAANDIGEPMTVAQLLQSMRGETVILTKDGSPTTGSIYGVENRNQGDDAREMVVLIGENGLSSHELNKFDSVKFAKPELNEKLMLALRGIVKSRQANQRELQLLFEGDKKRNVKFAYVVDMPIWRMTYRLLWEKEKAYLQGWAHVDNVSGVDWKQVDLELRSGKPATFHTNVFAPVLAQRRNIGTSAYEFMSGLSVVTQWFGFPAAPRYDSSNRNRRRRSSGGFGGGFGGGGLGGRATLGEGDEAAGVDARTGFENSAETEKVSQMVVYRISEAVSLGSGKSAALPAFEMELPGELMSIANLTNRSNDITPVQAIELENDTDFSLLSGPVSVMRKGSFAGDGKLPRVDVKQKAYVHFGIDRPLKAKQLGEESFQQILKLERDKKNLLQTWRMNRKVTFRVVNLDVEDRTVLIKTARERANEELVEPEPYRKTDANLMYKVQVKAGETRELAVTFSYVEVQSKSWTELRRIETAQWDAAGVSIPEKDLALMKQVAELNQKIDLEGERVFVWAEKRHRTETEQERIRDNLSVFFDAKSKDAEPIIAQFAKLEKTIAECDREVEKTKTFLKELEAEKKDLIK